MRIKNYNQFRFLKGKQMKKLKCAYPKLEAKPGIYMFYRVVAYIGKSSEKDGILGRCASHCVSAEQHIDKSIKSRKLSCDGGQWYITPLAYCDKSKVDEAERRFISEYREKGYELYNIESGGTEGKTLIAKRKPAKGYMDGLRQGRENVRREISHWFEISLDYSIKGAETKTKINAREKFEEFLKNG